ncbi:hypothetical protein HX89_08895 [Dermacoccus nishinomiyaensis]|uniref:HTH cro/C1-type domain-containing protein n=1 Tax=Dermacoccus nishinomiyaensis TaxID=1274 RepID=A0A075JFL9_9MICO|nr:helix-turn-helix transcriptional regulator [Dermacoccus nishinomiyaensis]AIF41041.1 hypothetical protein HX89_08895 [Dermacoccus nishinomiyaensis]
MKTEDDWFAENVAAERKRLGWTQAELAERLRSVGMENFHPNTISRVEKGERPVKLSEAAKFALVFETTVGTLVRPRIERLQELSKLVADFDFAIVELVKANREAALVKRDLIKSLSAIHRWRVDAKLTEEEIHHVQSLADGALSRVNTQWRRTLAEASLSELGSDGIYRPSKEVTEEDRKEADQMIADDE